MPASKSAPKGKKKSAAYARSRPSRAYGAWRKAWKTENTPWVAPEADRPLIQFLRSQRLPKGQAEALVPLCGNSSAVKSLYRFGYQVTGVEYVPEAVASLKRQFGGGAWKSKVNGPSKQYCRKGVCLLQQDFFLFDRKNAFDLVYDRAAFVAINPRHRRRYAAILRRSLKPGGLLYIIVFRMRGAEPPGPPFGVTQSDLKKHFSGLRLVRSKITRDRRPPPRYSAAGVKEIVYECRVYQRRLNRRRSRRAAS